MRSARILLLAFLAIIGGILTESLWGVPIVACAARYGSLEAFAIFTAIYGLLSFGTGFLAVRHINDRSPNKRLAVWLASPVDSKLGRIAKQSLSKGHHVGFVISSIIIGPAPTVWLLYSLGRSTSMRVAFLSSAIFTVVLVAPYSGIGGLLGKSLHI